MFSQLTAVTAAMVSLLFIWISAQPNQTQSSRKHVLPNLLMQLRPLQRFALLLTTFPLFYWTFALWAGDFSAFSKEVVSGIPIFILASIGFFARNKLALKALLLGFAIHAVYDGFHPELMQHFTPPSWWPTYCGIVDTGLIFMILFPRFWQKK